MGYLNYKAEPTREEILHEAKQELHITKNREFDRQKEVLNDTRPVLNMLRNYHLNKQKLNILAQIIYALELINGRLYAVNEFTFFSKPPRQKLTEAQLIKRKLSRQAYTRTNGDKIREWERGYRLRCRRDRINRMAGVL